MKYIIEEDQLKQYIEADFTLSSLIIDAMAGIKLDETSVSIPDFSNFIIHYNCGHNTKFYTIEECIDDALHNMLNDGVLQKWT